MGAQRSEEWKALTAANREAELREPLRTWWLSFADETGFLGVAIVIAHGPLHAIAVCRDKKCGTEGRGEVHATLMPENFVPDRWYFRLLTEDEVATLEDELDRIAAEHPPS